MCFPSHSCGARTSYFGHDEWEGVTCDLKTLPDGVDLRNRLYGAFEQADREVSRRLGGLGLGLAIARGLVAEHKGELAAVSAGRDQGSTFTLTLPRAN